MSRFLRLEELPSPPAIHDSRFSRLVFLLHYLAVAIKIGDMCPRVCVIIILCVRH
jgi:hypothetical protein